ncbi:uncharacterized protein LOC132397469, partial [Hypanus sabinus]|uniref:uncharacterized protein LOC132397469 n=1 Tax=Hypanus sabinus TaxID=79690 RepID=UPI0028C50166
EPSTSPWRAQVVVVRTGQKNRMVVDYSQTINRFTQLDAYPLPRIADMVNQIAQYKVYSTIDLKSAYHQLPICPEDRPYTAFEAGGRLYHFLRVPFGVTNGVSVFQREMDRMVDQYRLQATFPYLDNITICGHDRPDHDANLQRFLQVAAALNLTYNRDKCVFDGAWGFFSYYAQWVPHYADKARPLVKSTSFPLSAEACAAFNCIKADIAKATMHAVDETAPFQVECDASDFALAATLNQEGRPVAFFSRTLQGSEIRHSAVEKEAQAIVEAVRHWRHYLAGKRFTVLTDQRSVAFLFSNQQRGKIKNDKILRWRIELSTYTYDILYRPGRLNEPPDALSRGTCASTQLDQLYALHAQLCHPGVTRFYHFVKARNLPYSLEDIRTMTRDCQICAECKPHFYCPDTAQLVKATRPFERLSVDFKGPLPSTDRNVYFLSVIDEFSRFPFAIPCPDTTATSVIKALRQLFTLFGYPCYIHSDRGSSFMSEELRQYLLARGIATSRTTSYNPRGNGQVERENATVWKATLYLASCPGRNKCAAVWILQKMMANHLFKSVKQESSPVMHLKILLMNKYESWVTDLEKRSTTVNIAVFPWQWKWPGWELLLEQEVERDLFWREAERSAVVGPTVVDDQIREIKESRLLVLSLAANLSFTLSLRPSRNTSWSASSFHPESAAHVQNSMEYSATLREP